MKNILKFPRSSLKLCQGFRLSRRAVGRHSWHESPCSFNVLTSVQNAHVLGAVSQYDRTSMKQPWIRPSAKVSGGLIRILLHQRAFLFRYTHHQLRTHLQFHTYDVKTPKCLYYILSKASV